MSIFDSIDATWAAVAYPKCGPFTLRLGKGGGKRVSAATTEQPVSEEDIERAEDGMRALEQEPLFALRGEQSELDQQLASRGYVTLDPTIIMGTMIEKVADTPPPPVSAFSIWPPLAIMRDIWATGGIGPDRLAVMQRVPVPKTAILGRVKDRAAGAAFVAVDRSVAMMHAVQVEPDLRRNGVAMNMSRAGAIWAREQGATCFVILTTRDNSASQGVYSTLGLEPVTHYHYRGLEREDENR